MKTEPKEHLSKNAIAIGVLLALCVGLAVFSIAFVNTRVCTNKESSDTTLSGALLVDEVATISLKLNNVTFEEFRDGKKDDKYKNNTLELTYNGETVTYEGVELKGRGNSTWGQKKPPFQLKLSESTDLLGLGEAKKWVFLANLFDDSNLRNDTAFKLADMLGEKYATRGEFVRVMMDGEYIGLYYLTHKMETKKGSVNLKDNKGILVEIENLHRETEECFDSKNGTCVTIKDTVADEDEDEATVTAAMGEFLEAYNKFEEAVRNKDYEAIKNVMDTESLAEYYLISEFSNNPDAYNSSFYFYKDGSDDIIHAGPIWDFDYAFGNQNWWYADQSTDIFSPYLTNPQRKEIRHERNVEEMYMLMDMPEFMDEVKAVYAAKLKGKKDELVSWVENRVAMIKEEARKDAEKWDIAGYESDMNYLVDWVSRRYDFFEYTYGK